jgi:ankyrin repeat protein
MTNWKKYPLHEACMNGYDKLVENLLTLYKYDVNEKDDTGLTPLHVACIYNHLNVAKILVENGANLLTKDRQGMMPIDYTGTKEHFSLVKFLLKKGAIPPTTQPMEKRTRHATTTKKVSFSLPMEKKITINKKRQLSPQKPTTNNVASALKAVERVAQKHQMVSVSTTAQARKKQRIDERKSLQLSTTNVNKALHDAVYKGDVQAVKSALSMGADIDVKRADGATSLHVACRRKHLAIVNVLLKNDADMTIKDGEGRTALDVARLYGTEAIVLRILVKKGKIFVSSLSLPKKASSSSKSHVLTKHTDGPRKIASLPKRL